VVIELILPEEEQGSCQSRFGEKSGGYLRIRQRNRSERLERTVHRSLSAHCVGQTYTAQLQRDCRLSNVARQLRENRLNS